MKLTKRRGCRDDEFFANMAVDAMLAVKTINPRGEIKYPVKAVNILKAHGKSATESIYVKGYALNCTVASQGASNAALFRSQQLILLPCAAMKTKIVNAKIACLDMNLMKARMHLGVHITIDDPEQLEAIRKRFVYRSPCAAELPTNVALSPASPTSPSSASARSSPPAPTSSLPPRESTTCASKSSSKRARWPFVAARRRTFAESPRRLERLLSAVWRTWRATRRSRRAVWDRRRRSCRSGSATTSSSWSRGPRFRTRARSFLGERTVSFCCCDEVFDEHD